MWQKDIARYQLSLPEQSNPDADGTTQDLKWMLPHFLHGLAKMGFSDSSVVTGVQGTWTDPNTGETFVEPMTRVDIDAEDSSENDHKLHRFAAEVARVTEQHKIYFVKHPLPRTLVDPSPTEQADIGLPGMEMGDIASVFT